MENFDLWSQLAALGQVIAIDLVLAGDNAIVIGMAAAGVPLECSSVLRSMKVSFVRHGRGWNSGEFAVLEGDRYLE